MHLDQNTGVLVSSHKSQASTSPEDRTMNLRPLLLRLPGCHQPQALAEKADRDKPIQLEAQRSPSTTATRSRS